MTPAARWAGMEAGASTIPSKWRSGPERLRSFADELDRPRRQVELESASGDAGERHIERICAWSRRCEVLIHFSVEPIGFMLGVTSLWLHKSLELMEIGHMALHGAYDHLPRLPPLHARRSRWRAPIDEASWRAGHNHRRHGFTKIAVVIRISTSAGYASAAASSTSDRTAFSRWRTWRRGSCLRRIPTAHVTGLIDVFRSGAPLVLPDRDRARCVAPSDASGRRRGYYLREYLAPPLLAGPFFWKPLLGNLFSEVGRDLFSGAVVYCGHVGAVDYPRGARAANRAEWLGVQTEGSRDLEAPEWLSPPCGGLDHQIEQHLFPLLPPNRLRR